MKKLIMSLMLCASSLSYAQSEQVDGDTFLEDYYHSDVIYQKLEISLSDYQHLMKVSNDLASKRAGMQYADYLSVAYLEAPNATDIIKVNALHHLLASFLVTSSASGEALKHSVLASYFLTRLKLLSPTPVNWADSALQRLEQQLAKHLSYGKLHVNEAVEAHNFFHDAFNYRAQNSQLAADKLLDELISDPSNVMTTTLITGAFLWLGGQVAYDDPKVLEYYVLTSFFSTRAILLSQEIEGKWQEEPNEYARMRLSSILGGWSALPKRWLAGIHNDELSKNKIEAEHQLWGNVNPGFHAVTLGSDYFSEPEQFYTGLGAWMRGSEFCNQIPSFRSCIDDPRFSFNRLVFIQGIIEHMIKLGDFNTAQMLLNARHWPDLQWDKWVSGQARWLELETNKHEIHQLWNNDDPADDPVFVTSKKRRWGDETMVCANCHQAQERHWTEEQKNTVSQPHSMVATIGDWPEFTTDWAGQSSLFQDCNSQSSWDKQQAYKKDHHVVYQHGVYRAKWWTQAEAPSNSNRYDVWEFIGWCHAGSIK
ncbi:hypothetical protein CWB96_19925 [Pseudoalteromonas citrea]|uniref:Chitin-binding type-3 domain-containing protein n=1 Tax=Pseudoalteromonas citrea TaxID=43655 RepID=A0A5S3XKM1_9GAMM|nr:hypothetical protein [Pseudoalteromonas citrea]TMP47146.1 hypothetical protein CWB97_00445 [Pseudoalteromonas citrea]TMP54101.1 hypothetical protein CWB96_19925 [Pseudoalteromonas citrea]